MRIKGNLTSHHVRKWLIATLTFAAFASSVVRAQTNVVGVGVPTGTTRTDTYIGAGYEFYAPVAGTTINSLGYWDANGTGLAAPHTVSLYKYSGSGSAYNLLVTATIPAGTSAPLINGYRWVGVGTTALPNNGQSGGYYAILADHTVDTWANSIGTAPYMSSAIGTVSGQGLITVNGSSTILSPTMNINGTGNPNNGFGGANLAFLTNTLPASATPSVVTWVEKGSFTDNTVLTKAGVLSNAVYGVDFGGSGLQTTANGYTFDDYATTGNATLGGTGLNSYNAYLSGGGTTGDPTFDSVLTSGVYGGSGNYCILNNLTPGQKYNVLALAADTRTDGNGAQFQESDYLSYSPAQTFGFLGGTPAIGGYVLGTFTAARSNQIFSMVSAHVQYNAILVAKWSPPVYPDIAIVTNLQPASLTLGIGGQVTYTAAFSNSPPVTVQWQFITNGVTNSIGSGVVNATNGAILVSSLTLTNLQLANSGSYVAKAIDATNALNFKFTTSVTLNVNNLIYWVQSGAFSNNTVLAIAGDPSNEVYGVDFGGSGPQATANGYMFDDFQTTGNMDVATGFSSYGGYLAGGATAGDGALDLMLTFGVYGGVGNVGTLKNLTVGQTYYVLVLLADTRGGAAGGSVFRSSDGVLVSASQPYAFENGTPYVGGYMLGRFTAKSTNQSLSVFNNYPFASQYNAILVAKTSPSAAPPIFITSDITPGSATVVEGGQVSFSASFGYSPPLNFQWQSIIGGVTNVISSGVQFTTNTGIITTSLTLTNLPGTASGSYRVKASDATNSLNFAYSSSATLSVVPLITWSASGTFTDNTVLTLAGSVANVVYASDFGGSGAQTTANGYAFDDGPTTGNATLTGYSSFPGYLTGGATTGDAAFDAVMTTGAYGNTSGTLNNLTPGQKYNVLVLLADTRGDVAGGAYFRALDGVTTTPYTLYAFTNGTPAVGGYWLGSFTANSTTHPLSVQISSFGITPNGNQYNGVVVAKSSATLPTAPTLAAPKYSGGNLILTGTGGTPGANYTWLTSTNLTAPIATWITNMSGVLSGTGSLSNAIPVDATKPQSFFRLRLP